MGANTSCHDCNCEKECKDGTSIAAVNAYGGLCREPSQNGFYDEEVCSLRVPRLFEEADQNGECRLRFQLLPAAPFGLQLAEATSQTPGGALSSVLVVQHVTDCSSLMETFDGQPGVHPGDAIVEANGRRGTAGEVRDALQQAVAASGTRDITLVVRRRPATFDVKIPLDASSQQKIGIAAIIDKTNPGCVLVTSVRSQGAVPAWNAVHAFSQVCAGDLITEVNGISCDAAAMCKEMQGTRNRTLFSFRIAAKEVSYQKTRQSKDPRLFSVRSLIQPVDFGRPQRQCAVDARRCTDLERWQTELEAKSQKLRREVELQFESSHVQKTDFHPGLSLSAAMSATKTAEICASDDEHASDVCPRSGSCTPVSPVGSFGARKSSDLQYL